MDNNTAQNSGIQYPNISTINTGTQPPPTDPPVQNRDDGLLKDLQLQVENPTPLPDTTLVTEESPVQTQQVAEPVQESVVPSQPPLGQSDQESTISAHEEKETDTFVQSVEEVVKDSTNTDDEVNDLSNIQEASPIIDVSDVPVDTKTVITEELQDIIPGQKIPKALKRSPKEHNLSKPLASPSGQSPVVVEELVSSDSTVEIEELLKYAIQYEASDLHITVGYPPIVRIDGELKEISDTNLSEQDVEKLIFPILSEEKKELLEVNKEIDIAYSYEGRGEYSSRFRINVFYSMGTLSAAFRLIPTRIRTIEELKLPSVYHRFAQLKQGFILVTGPTGHGKSTTLAAILDEINRTRFTHIVTIEDPVEYVFEGKKSLIDQREMNEDTHSWSIALRSAFRQDPDVILVGEMRDYETISSAITLAETGHLVFATLHTNNAAQTVDRIIDVFPHNQQAQIRLQLSNILEAIVAQRLIPLDKGGRRAVTEIMIANPAVRNLIRESKTHQLDNVIRTSADIGMVSLERSLVGLVREGVISISKAQEYAVFPEEVLRLLKS